MDTEIPSKILANQLRNTQKGYIHNQVGLLPGI